jgi:hypothetical protein
MVRVCVFCVEFECVIHCYIFCVDFGGCGRRLCVNHKAQLMRTPPVLVFAFCNVLVVWNLQCSIMNCLNAST